MDITQGLPNVPSDNTIVSRAVPVVPHAAPPHAAGEREVPSGTVTGYDPLTNPPAGNECD